MSVLSYYNNNINLHLYQNQQDKYIIMAAIIIYGILFLAMEFQNISNLACGFDAGTMHCSKMYLGLLTTVWCVDK